MLDAVVAAFIIVLSATLALNRNSLPHYTGPAWVACVIAAGLGLPVAVRRRWPLGALAALIPFSAAAALLDISYLGMVPVGLVLYTVAAVAPNRWSWTGLIVALVITCGALMYSGGPVLITLLLSIMLWALGLSSRYRQRDEARLAEQREQRVVLGERLRIARDLHDIVAHSMSLIAVKAGVANHLAETRPGETRAALAVIEATSREALEDLRRMLGVLRATDGTEAELRPVHGLGELNGLARWAETAGVTVELDVAELELPEGVQQAVYRIVQEALTNVVRHSGAGHCQVRLHGDDTEVVVEVTDPGGRRTPGGPGGGHGLVGMRERVAAYGGILSTGRLPGGGFGVCARLPVGATG
ncbi:sensor histidine kinase [Crossiella sp. S99.2]|nr:sensor histidine kinase [Crossiella sp. S99.2]